MYFVECFLDMVYLLTLCYFIRCLACYKVRSFLSLLMWLFECAWLVWVIFNYVFIITMIHISWFLASIDLQINCHSYLNLISRDLYLRVRGVLPYGTFPIDNMNLGFGLSFERHTFPNKKSFLDFIFYFVFPLKNKQNKWWL